MKKYLLVIISVLVLVVLFGCGIPFDYTSDTITIELQNTGGLYVEGEVPIPEAVQKSGVSFSDITLYYTVRKNDSFVADVALYASSDETADNVKGADDEKLIDVNLGLTESEVSGTTASEKIRDALNNKQQSFVIGGENLSGNPLGSIFIDIKVRFQGNL